MEENQESQEGQEVAAPVEEDPKKDHIGPPEEVSEIKHMVLENEQMTDEAVLNLLAMIRNRAYESKITLDAIKSSIPHLLTEFFAEQASAALGIVERLLTAAIDLNPSDASPTPPSSTPPAEGEDGTGQYL